MHHVARSLVPGTLRHVLPRVPRRVVILGGGPVGMFCADRLRHHFEVTLVDSKSYFEYTPGILRALGDPAHHARLSFDYREVLEGSLGVEFVQAEAVRVDPSPIGGCAGSVAVASPKGDAARVAYDYCVVAIGFSNGIWKPQIPGVAPSSSTSSLGGSSSLLSSVDERSHEARRQNLQSLRERLATAPGAVIVGAGLVGVELAAELAHFFPRLSLSLVDASAQVLPQLSEGSREYARQYLVQHGVNLKLGEPFLPETVPEGHVVLWCVGGRARTQGLFEDSSVLTQRGMVRTNQRMQVLRKAAAAAPPTARKPGEGASAEGVDTGASEVNDAGAAPVFEPLGQGRIYAVGDVAAVEGVPTAQMIFHGEETAAVAVASIEAAEDIASPLSMSRKREIEAEGLPLFCCTSLGPQDGMFSTQSELLASGTLAVLQKQMIEDTKMSALRGELLGSLMWMPVH